VNLEPLNPGDTNVLMSGIFFSGPPYQILKAWQKDKFNIVISENILTEYQRVAEELCNFSISWGRLHFATIHWIPAPALDYDPGFAGMTGIYIQTSFRRKPESRHLILSY